MAEVKERCACICHKVGLLGFMCCPCTVKLFTSIGENGGNNVLTPAAVASHAPATAGSDEQGWLSEKGQLCLGSSCHKPAWVTFTDPYAVRFARKIDAENMLAGLRSMGDGEAFSKCTVSSHMWLADSPAPSAPATGKEQYATQRLDTANIGTHQNRDMVSVAHPTATQSGASAPFEPEELNKMLRKCKCICHKVGLFGFLCCPCTTAAISDFAHSGGWYGFVRQGVPDVPERGVEIGGEGRERDKSADSVHPVRDDSRTETGADRVDSVSGASAAQGAREFYVQRNNGIPPEAVIWNTNGVLRFAEAYAASLRSEVERLKAELAAERSGSNCEKLDRERKTKRHWQQRAESAERTVSELRARMAVALKTDEVKP